MICFFRRTVVMKGLKSYAIPMFFFLLWIVFLFSCFPISFTFPCLLPRCIYIYIHDQVIVILRNIPQESRKMLSAKGFFRQEGYILHYLPVPPNCLLVPDVLDASSVMSSVSTFSTSIFGSIYNLISTLRHHYSLYDYAVAVLKKGMK